MKTQTEILVALTNIDDVQELKSIQSAIRHRIKEVSSRLKYDLKINDKVKVTSKRGSEYGVVTRVNITRAVVNLDCKGHYNVPFSMITKA